MIVLAGLIYGLSRRKPVTAGTVNDAPPPPAPPQPVAVAAARVAA
jgi:hypothetical protein